MQIVSKGFVNKKLIAKMVCANDALLQKLPMAL